VIGQFHDQVALAVVLIKRIDVDDVRVIERREQLRLALKPSHALGIIGERLRQKFESDVPSERQVACAINLAHAARTEQRDDLVRTKDSAWDHR